MPSLERSQLSSLSSAVSDLAERSAELAAGLDDAGQSEAVTALYEAERALEMASRSLARAARSLAD